VSRPGRRQERNTGETANLGGFAATVTDASFEQSVSDFENDGYLKERPSAAFLPSRR
jgi:hypothetical protein